MGRLRRVITLGVIVAVLAGGSTLVNRCGNGFDISKAQYFNPNPQVETTGPQENISYDALVDLVRQNEGKLEVNLLTTEVGKGNEVPSVGYAGFGYAWANKMRGTLEENILVTSVATEVGNDNKRPAVGYAGYGYGWAEEMKGFVGENQFFLHATKVGKENETPPIGRVGFGYAWAQEMTGTLGDRLNVKFTATDISKENERPAVGNVGFGYGWANRGTLTLTLR